MWERCNLVINVWGNICKLSCFIVQKFFQAKQIRYKSKSSLLNNKMMGKINTIMEKRYRQCVDSREV